MGIPRGTARLLLDEAKARPFSGSILQFGRSSVYFGLESLREWSAAAGVPLAPNVTIELSHDAKLAAQGCLSDRSFFRLLGFDRVEALDVSARDGAQIVHDLNLPIPAELEGRYDTVFEAGTIQHVFDLPTVLDNVHRLLAPGGRVIHGMTPSSNHVDHGFFMFSPTLFHDYYTANGYQIEAEYFFEFRPVWVGSRFDSRPWKIYRYSPGCIDHLSYGGFGRRQVGLFVVATRAPTATSHVAPIQGYFARSGPWNDERIRAPHRIAGMRRRIELALLSRWPTRGLLLIWKHLRRLLVGWLPRRLPPLVKRY